MDLIDILGALAATLTTISFLPQTIQVIKTRHTKDLSLYMYILLTSGIFLWLCYGIASLQWPIIISNAICLPLCVTILIIKVLEKE